MCNQYKVVPVRKQIGKYWVKVEEYTKNRVSKESFDFATIFLPAHGRPRGPTWASRELFVQYLGMQVRTEANLVSDHVDHHNGVATTFDALWAAGYGLRGRGYTLPAYRVPPHTDPRLCNGSKQT